MNIIVGWVAVVLISIILFIMIVFGIYYVIAQIQVKLIYNVLDELWDSCSIIYYYIDENKKDILSKCLKDELNVVIDPIEYELPKDDEKSTKLKKILANIPKLFDKYEYRLEKSCILARDIAYGSEEEVREVTNVISRVLSNI